MRVLSQVNKFTFEEVEVPDEVMEDLYREWYQRSLDEMDTERFDAIHLLSQKKSLVKCQ